MIGETILHYKIIEKLGEGGMGVVYKAEDTKLSRTVVLKFLPGQISSDKTAKERFLIETKGAAGLNHPNIATIYSIEDSEEGMFIVMEYVDGQTLKRKIETDPFTISEAFAFSLQVADGLYTAHKNGVVHRDIKTPNLMVTQYGTAKIMDFGLAKLAEGSLLKKDGTTLGTAAYMSPEQARGDKVDHKTDIRSFGVVLYEMLCGQRPFKGEYEQAVMYSIMNTDPEPITDKLPKLPERIEGSSPLNIAEVNPYARGGTWNNNDQIVFTKGGNEGLNLVDINTGEVTVLTVSNKDSNETSHMWSEFLPNGKDVLFSIYKTGEFDNSKIALYSLENNNYRILFNQPGVNAQYAASGHLVYYRTGELLVVPFDIKTYQIIGDPVVITNDFVLPFNFNDGNATYDFSEDGTYTIVTSSDNVINFKMIFFDRQGNTVKVLLENQTNINFPRISPDNKRVAYTVSEYEVGEIHIEIVDLENINRKIKATYEPGTEGYPVWSKDSKKLYYFSYHTGFVADIHWVSSSGDNIGGELIKMTNPIYPISISPNGLLAFYEINPESIRDIWMYSFKDSTSVPFIANSTNETSPEFSPNGKWLAYSSNETGSDEVYVTSMEDKSKRWKISAAGGNLVSWNSNGRELFYFEDKTLMSVPVKTDNNFEYGIPQRLFSKNFNVTNVHFPNYDHISTTDQFITVIIEPENDNPRINVVLNWFEELKRLAPVNKE